MSLFSPSELSFTSIPLTSTSKPSSNLRSDARKPLNYRNIILDTSITEGTNIGNCKVLIGDSILGFTEICAGVRAEVEDLNDQEEIAEGNKNEESSRIVVTVECAAPLQNLIPASLILHLSTLLSSLFSPSLLPPSLLSHLTIIPSKKSWKLYLDILILSNSGGNVLDLSIIAARSALSVCRLPSVKPIGFEEDVTVGVSGKGGNGGEGINGLVKGGIAGTRVVDFELVDGGWEEGERLHGWENLPIGITLNLINQLPHLDSTVLEESATSTNLIACFTSSGDLCAVKQIGEGEIEFGRLIPLLGEAKKYSSDLIQVLNAKLKDA